MSTRPVRVLSLLALSASSSGCFTKPPAPELDDYPLDKLNSYECDCTCTSDPLPADRQISAIADDAEEVVSSGAVNVTDNSLDMTAANGSNNGAPQLIGLYFRNLGIPAGATISSAFVQFTASAASSSTTNLRLAGQAAGDALTFAGIDYNISGRPLTTLSVNWTVPPWTTGEAGSNQATPSLVPIIQQIVGLPSWQPGSSIVIVVSGTGNRSAWSFDGRATSAPKLVLTYTPQEIGLGVAACMTAADNPNLNGGDVPSPAQLQDDCSTRVATTLSHMAQACNYPRHCTCSATSDKRRLAEVCDEPCPAVDPGMDCSRFNPMNNTVSATIGMPGDTPVCTVHSPLAASIFGRRSHCEVTSGTATLSTSDETETSNAHGSIDLIGTPCAPGQTCSIATSYLLDIDNMTFGNLFGSATFSELAGNGETVSGQTVQIGTDGKGVIAPNATRNTSRGKRDNGDVAAFVSSNENGIDLTASFATATCGFSGSLIGSVDPELKRCENAGPYANQVCTTDAACGTDPNCSGTDGQCLCRAEASSDANLGLDVEGDIRNQPPTANAGPNLDIECNQTGGARFELNGSASDPDGNIAEFLWIRGGRAGTIISGQPLTQVNQSVGAATTYVFRAIDTWGQAGESSMVATVVDTTAPVSSCNAPATIPPPLTPISFGATATDTCDAQPQVKITSWSCTQATSTGTLDLGRSCQVSTSGNVITLKKSNGVGVTYTWNVEAKDTAGNVSNTTCRTTTVLGSATPASVTEGPTTGDLPPGAAARHGGCSATSSAPSRGLSGLLLGALFLLGWRRRSRPLLVKQAAPGRGSFYSRVKAKSVDCSRFRDGKSGHTRGD